MSACSLCECCSPTAQDIGALDYGFEPQSLPDDYEVLSDSAVERDR